MSPASKSKGKDKSSSAKITKEQHKASSKPSSTSGGGGGGSTGNGGVMASAYNPLSGTFHTLETAPTASSPPPHSNGRFRNIDETDDHSNSSLGTGAEYDSVSNNDSCSGESEDLKEKSGGPSTTTAARQEAIPGSDNDKREKIRQKNERKHQRQRERRAQELHERCSGYLMSRKLESLAQQLVGMGFSSERATMALILNEGRMEESVAWLFEGSEEGSQQSSSLESGSNLKIDITEELNQITGMEITYKCSKQEVERAVVTCEGDLEKASEILNAQKQQELATCPPKPGETGDPLVNNGKLPVRPQVKTSVPVVIQQRRDDSSRDFNYTKAPPASPSPSTVMTSPEPSRNFQPLRRPQLQPPVAAPPQPAQPKYQPPAAPVVDKRWQNGGGSSMPSVSYPLPSPLQAALPLSKPELPRYEAVNNKIPTTVSVREPVIMMQRPQSTNVKPNYHHHLATSINIPTPSTAGFGMTPNNMSYNTQQQYYTQQQQQQQPYISGSQLDMPGSGWGNSYGTAGASSQPSPSSLAVPSSLGLFSGWGSTGGSGSSSPVDWSTGGGPGSIPQCDYTSIDWTLESTQPARSSTGLWTGLADFVKNNRIYESASGVNVNQTRGLANGGVRGGFQEGVVAAEMSSVAASSSSDVVGVHHPPPPPQQQQVAQHEWTTPFAGKDLFSLPRQFVTSPSL